MSRGRAFAKINLALVVGPRRADGKHEVVTVLQRIDLHDEIEVEPADALVVDGFAEDTIVREALLALADVAGVAPRWRVRIAKRIPVAAGLGGGSSDAATALQLANATLDAPRSSDELHRIAARIGADVPFFLHVGAQLATGDGTELTPVELPSDYWVVLVMPDGDAKESTGKVYAAFDERGGAVGFEERADSLRLALAATRTPRELARLPANDLASSSLSRRIDQSRRIPRGCLRSRPDGVRALRVRKPTPIRPRRCSNAQAARWSRARSTLTICHEWQDDARSGAWPSGKATGFGPVIPGSNPGAPASVPSSDERTLGAVVMAAGLGTRMRSEIPKHLHAILGRRMVDWVIASTRQLGVDPLVVVVAPANAAAFDGMEVAVQARAPRHGRRRSLRAAGPRRQSRRRPGPVRRHAVAHVANPSRARRDTSPRARCGDGSVLRARRPEAVRPCAAVACRRAGRDRRAS